MKRRSCLAAMIDCKTLPAYFGEPEYRVYFVYENDGGFFQERMYEMRRILFVDDNPDEIERLREMLEPMQHEWEVEFAVSGEEALNSMA